MSWRYALTMTPSARQLIVPNVFTLVVVITLHQGLGALLWPYWIQSVIIGWYARKRMLELNHFTTDGFTSNNRQVPATEEGKRSTAGFFVFHYGFFHAGYFLFIARLEPISSLRDTLLLVACGISFVLAQRKTYAAQHAADLAGEPNLGTLMFQPYLRIVPMHLTIVLAPKDGGMVAMVFFVALKTAADVLFDHIDRRIAVNAVKRLAAAPPATVATATDATATDAAGASAAGADAAANTPDAGHSTPPSLPD